MNATYDIRKKLARFTEKRAGSTYQTDISIGYRTIDFGDPKNNAISFQGALIQADAIMYTEKKGKKEPRASRSSSAEFSNEFRIPKERVTRINQVIACADLTLKRISHLLQRNEVLEREQTNMG